MLVWQRLRQSTPEIGSKSLFFHNIFLYIIRKEENANTI